MKIWIALCLTWFAARMSFAAPALVQDGVIFKKTSRGQVEKLLLGSGLRSQLPLRSLTASNFTQIELALRNLKKSAQGKTASAISSDMAELIRSFTNFDGFLSGSIPESMLPIEMPELKLTKVEAQVYKVMARTVIYPESVYYLKLVKRMNRILSSNTSLISESEQQTAQSKCFAKNKLTLTCLYSKSLSAKLTKLLTSIGMSEEKDFEHDEIIEAIVALINKKAHTKNIVAKRLFFYEGAEHVLKNHSQMDLFAICVGNEKNFRYWQMESMTHCRSVWQKELGSLDMDAELESIFFRQVTKFDAKVMRLVQGLSNSVLAPKTGCAKKDKTCLEKVIKTRLSAWSLASDFSEGQIEDFSKSLAASFII